MGYTPGNDLGTHPTISSELLTHAKLTTKIASTSTAVFAPYFAHSSFLFSAFQVDPRTRRFSLKWQRKRTSAGVYKQPATTGVQVDVRRSIISG